MEWLDPQNCSSGNNMPFIVSCAVSRASVTAMLPKRMQ